jgi:UDP-glucuronate 4-epimerase
MPNPRRTLVTGGAGFIGSHLVDRLVERGDDVTAIDNFDPFYAPEIKRQNIARHEGKANFRFFEVDIRQLQKLKGLLKGQDFDVICHLAAKAGVRPSIKDPVAYQEVNVFGTQNLLEIAREKGVKQFVFTSSSSVYGMNPNVPWREEDHVLMPISPYASTKVSGELLGHVYSHLYGIRFLALRLFTVYGPRQRPDLAIHKFTKMILGGKPIPVYGDGSTRRDYTFVADIVKGLMAAMDYKGTNYEVINMGNNRTVSLNEMIETLEELLGRKAKRETKPLQAGDVPQTWASVEKSQACLGFRPNTPFKEGVKAFTEWYSKERGVL